MASPNPNPSTTPWEASFIANLERTRLERARLAAEHGDLTAYVDRIAEELFGDPAAANVLLEYVLRSAGELDPSEDDADGDG